MSDSSSWPEQAAAAEALAHLYTVNMVAGLELLRELDLPEPVLGIMTEATYAWYDTEEIEAIKWLGERIRAEYDLDDEEDIAKWEKEAVFRTICDLANKMEDASKEVSACMGAIHRLCCRLRTVGDRLRSGEN